MEEVKEGRINESGGRKKRVDEWNVEAGEKRDKTKGNAGKRYGKGKNKEEEWREERERKKM